MKWAEKVSVLGSLLELVEITDRSGTPLDTDAGFERWIEMTRAARRGQRTVYFAGNGASASMASHFSADLAKNGRVHTEVFTDPALVTAIANDMGYDHVFAEPLRRRGRTGDVFVAVSSSGSSANILAGAETAHALDVQVVSLSAMDAANPLRRRGDLNFYVPAKTYGDAETSHAAILHHWMDAMALDFEPSDA
jgi:D-sedoheptulose 7-phosphate isomerase